MSEERLQELGVSRRQFVKRIVAGAFVAPVVVSFGLDSAQAGTQHFGNQHFGNQTINCFQPGLNFFQRLRCLFLSFFHH